MKGLEPVEWPLRHIGSLYKEVPYGNDGFLVDLSHTVHAQALAGGSMLVARYI